MAVRLHVVRYTTRLCADLVLDAQRRANRCRCRALTLPFAPLPLPKNSRMMTIIAI